MLGIGELPEGVFAVVVIVLGTVAAIGVVAMCFDPRCEQSSAGYATRSVVCVLSLAWIAYWTWGSFRMGGFIAILSFAPFLVLRKLRT